MGELIMWGVLSLLVFWILYQAVRVVPQRSNYVVEFLGKYQKTLQAGLHILIPFVQRVAYIQSLKEETIDVPSQSCITKDNIAVDIDGILYLQCQNAELASYGIDDYRYATSQLAQTTLRSVCGQVDLDDLLSDRERINLQIQTILDEQTDPWGIKVVSVEVKHIDLPQEMQRAMAKQAEAERDPLANEVPEHVTVVGLHHRFPACRIPRKRRETETGNQAPSAGCHPPPSTSASPSQTRG